MNERLNVLYRIRVRVARLARDETACLPEDGRYHTKISRSAEW